MFYGLSIFSAWDRETGLDEIVFFFSLHFCALGAMTITKTLTVMLSGEYIARSIQKCR